MNDIVNHPEHYTQGGVECIDAIAAATTGLQGIEAVCTANVIKYIWRWKRKNGVEDIKKALWYLNKLKSVVEKPEPAEREAAKIDPGLSELMAMLSEMPRYGASYKCPVFVCSRKTAASFFAEATKRGYHFKFARRFFGSLCVDRIDTPNGPIDLFSSWTCPPDAVYLVDFGDEIYVTQLEESEKQLLRKAVLRRG